MDRRRGHGGEIGKGMIRVVVVYEEGVMGKIVGLDLH